MYTEKIKIIKDILGNDYLAVVASGNLLVDAYILISKVNDLIDFKPYLGKLLKRNNGELHLTVINVAELNSNTDCLKLNNLVIDDITMTGVGSIAKDGMRTWFIVCNSKKINNLRSKYGLSDKDLHITIGFTDKDLFHDRKNIPNIIN